jgi:6-phosphogluconate dehydrogenase
MVVPTSTKRAAVRGMARGSTRWAIVSARNMMTPYEAMAFPARSRLIVPLKRSRIQATDQATSSVNNERLVTPS